MAVPEWEGFDKLIRFLEKHYGATVGVRADGPDARRYVLSIDGLALELQHEDPWGNVLVAATPESEALLHRIAADLAVRLARP